jgi:hypothetical protein
MAYKASIQTLEAALRRANETALWMKTVHTKASADLSGTVTSDLVFRLVDETRGAISILNAQASVPGIVAYAQQQFNDATYDVAAEFNNMVSKLTAVVAWVGTNFPKDGSGFVLGYTISGDGSRTPRSFSAASTTGLKNAVDAVVTSIA